MTEDMGSFRIDGDIENGDKSAVFDRWTALVSSRPRDIENRGRFAHQVLALEDDVEEDIRVDEQLHVLLLAVLLVKMAPGIVDTRHSPAPHLRGPRVRIMRYRAKK